MEISTRIRNYVDGERPEEIFLRPKRQAITARSQSLTRARFSFQANVHIQCAEGRRGGLFKILIKGIKHVVMGLKFL